MVHIDLCAAAYGILEFESGILDLVTMEKTGIAPVFMFQCEEVHFAHHDVPEYQHKLIFTRELRRAEGLVGYLSPDIRHFKSIDDCNFEITPLNAYIERN
jgi:hypothetical protein